MRGITNADFSRGGQNVTPYPVASSEVEEMVAKYFTNTNTMKAHWVWKPTQDYINGTNVMSFSVGSVTTTKLVPVFGWTDGIVYFLRYHYGMLSVNGRTVPKNQIYSIALEVTDVNTFS